MGSLVEILSNTKTSVGLPDSKKSAPRIKLLGLIALILLLLPAATKLIQAQTNEQPHLDHFWIGYIGTQTVGQEFTVTITAKNQFGDTYTDYNGFGTLTDFTGVSVPVTFSNGGGTAKVTIYRAYTNDKVSVNSNGESNPFNVIDNNPIWIEAIGGAIFVLLPATSVILYRRRSNKNIYNGILPPGWQFYTKPTEAEKPGTVFRITNDKNRFLVGHLPVKIRECDVCTGKYTRKTTLNIFLRFTELGNLTVTNRAKKIQRLVFELKEPKDERTYDVDLDPLLKQLFENNAYREEDQYFIIRDATKTQEINYQLTQDQVESLGGEVSFKKALKQRSLLSSIQENQHVIKQKFDKPMRVMFNAEQMKMKLDKSGNMKFSFHRVKRVLEWTEQT